MTELDVADIVYIEPLTPEIVAKIIEKENPDGILPTMGGQTGLNLASSLAVMGVLKEHDVKVLGTPIETIQKGEDRDSFANLMKEINEPIPPNEAVTSISEALEVSHKIGYPVIIRPAYTLGGGGGGIANNDQELEKIAGRGMQVSMIHQILVEKSVAGWYEIEYEVMRDSRDNCITICSMENIDPMGSTNPK